MKYIASLSFAAFLACAGAEVDAAQNNSHAPTREQVQGGLAAADRHQCREAVPTLRGAADGDAFLEYSEETRRSVLSKLVGCAFELQQVDVALPYLQRLTETPGGDTDFWLVQLLWAESLSSSNERIIDTLQRISSRGQGAMNYVPPDLLRRIYTEMSRFYLNVDLRDRYLRILYEAEYAPTDPFEDVDWLMVAYARMAMDRGDTATAQDVILGLTEPRIMLTVRIDRRFDELRRKGRIESHLDLEAAAQRQIARFGRLVKRYPGALEGYISLSEALEAARRYQDALDVIEPVALRLMEPGGRDDFFDAEVKENWALERYADALAQTGQRQRSDEVHLDASMVAEDSHINVSQKINYAANQFNKGNYSRSLAALSEVADSSTSDFGNILVNLYTVCAISMGGIQQDYYESLSFLLENERLFGDEVFRAYLCLDELDSAARNLIRRLEHPEGRVDVLESLQVYADDREHLDQVRAIFDSNPADSRLSPGDLIDLRLDKVRQRDDVMKAVNAVGRIELVPLDSGRRD